MSLPAQLEGDRALSARQRPWAYHAALLVALLLVAVRSFVVVWYEQADFDSDQAVMGLMAKHLAEGRAFPLFQYVQDYVLVVEAWLAVPVFWVAGVSVLTLKATVAALNGVAAWLLLRILTAEVGLRPSLAVIAGAFFLFPAPITSATLVESLGPRASWCSRWGARRWIMAACSPSTSITGRGRTTGRSRTSWWRATSVRPGGLLDRLPCGVPGPGAGQAGCDRIRPDQ
jgi:hypothetical protein